MTFAPPTLVALGAYLVAHDAVNLGIVGDASHVATGTSYHLGKDRLVAGAYSAVQARDVAGLSNAASAIDVGRINGTLTGLQAFSRWLVSSCRAAWGDVHDPTHDIREVIFSPDGDTVYRWESLDNQVRTGPGQGDLSHLTHTHISYYRDSEFRSKIPGIAPYFEGDDVKVTKVIRQLWTAVGTDGVLRPEPIRTLAPSDRLPAGTPVISVAEANDDTGNSWRLTEWPAGVPKWFIRTGPGIPPDHDFRAGAIDPGTDTTATFNAGVTAGAQKALEARK